MKTFGFHIIILCRENVTPFLSFNLIVLHLPCFFFVFLNSCLCAGTCLNSCLRLHITSWACFWQLCVWLAQYMCWCWRLKGILTSLALFLKRVKALAKESCCVVGHRQHQGKVRGCPSTVGESEPGLGPAFLARVPGDPLGSALLPGATAVFSWPCLHLGWYLLQVRGCSDAPPLSAGWSHPLYFTCSSHQSVRIPYIYHCFKDTVKSNKPSLWSKDCLCKQEHFPYIQCLGNILAYYICNKIDVTTFCSVIASQTAELWELAGLFFHLIIYGIAN